MTSSQSSDGITVQNLFKHYGEHSVNALQGVSMQIYPGEFVALMGPSGCGKSTLLNIIGTLEVPTEGSVFVDSVNLQEIPERELTQFRRSQLGFIFQFFNLLSTLTVEENVSIVLELERKQKLISPQLATHTILERVGMKHRAKFFPAQLSGGEMQRVAIARALVHKPSIILADEPTGNLDSENGKAILTLLKEVSREYGQIILMATHSEEAASFADRTIRMRDGKIYNA